MNKIFITTITLWHDHETFTFTGIQLCANSKEAFTLTEEMIPAEFKQSKLCYSKRVKSFKEIPDEMILEAAKEIKP